MLGAWVGKLIGDPNDSAEDQEMPDSLNFFRDMAISISLIMIVVGFVAAILAIIQVGVAGLQESVSCGQNWFVFTLLQALGFTAGVFPDMNITYLHGFLALITGWFWLKNRG